MLTYYHVSPSANRAAILAHGVRQVPEARRRYGLQPSGIYVWSHLEMARWYAASEARDWQQPMDIWEVTAGHTQDDTTTRVPYAKRADCVRVVKLIGTLTGKRVPDVETIIEDIETRSM